MPKRKRAPPDPLAKFGFVSYKRSDDAAVARQTTIDEGRKEREDAARLKDKVERAAHAAAKEAAKRRVGRPRKVVLTQPAEGSAGPSQAATDPPPSTPMQGLAGMKRGKYTNWYQLQLADLILSTVARLGSVEKAVGHLNLHMPILFSKLSSSTIRGWFMPLQLVGKRYAVLKPGTQASLLQGCQHKSGGRRTAMAEFQEAEDIIVEALNRLRVSGEMVNSSIASCVIRGLLEVHAPEALEGSKAINLTLRWVRHFMQKRMGWTYRRATSAAQKLPENRDQLVDSIEAIESDSDEEPELELAAVQAVVKRAAKRARRAPAHLDGYASGGAVDKEESYESLGYRSQSGDEAMSQEVPESLSVDSV